MKFQNLHIVWTAGRNLALPDTLSRNTPPEWITRKTMVEIPQNMKFFLANDETSQRSEYKNAVKIDLDNAQIINLQFFSLYLGCQRKPLQCRLVRKPIPYHYGSKTLHNKNHLSKNFIGQIYSR